MPVYTYTTLDDPVAVPGNTQAFGINGAGQIVGLYSAVGLHGFLLSGGTYTTLDVPGALGGTTQANGINDLGQIVGNYRDPSSSGIDSGFLLSGAIYTPLVNPLAPLALPPIASNDAGQIVSGYTDGT